jgi:hypothetical protein
MFQLIVNEPRYTVKIPRVQIKRISPASQHLPQPFPSSPTTQKRWKTEHSVSDRRTRFPAQTVATSNCEKLRYALDSVRSAVELSRDGYRMIDSKYARVHNGVNDKKIDRDAEKLRREFSFYF